MFGTFRWPVGAAIFAMGVAAFDGASATTITSSATRPTGGVALTLDPADFLASGGPGYGGSVIGDPYEVSTKNAASPHPYGRFDPLGGTWVDSNDNPTVAWSHSYSTPIRSITFALTDAFDQEPNFGLGPSFFTLSVEDAIWSIPSREANGTLHWITVLFDAPTGAATLLFETRTNDGWGVSAAEVAPVPLPPAVLLLGTGLALMGALRRRSLRES